jgi:hypothetical protein
MQRQSNVDIAQSRNTSNEEDTDSVDSAESTSSVPGSQSPQDSWMYGILDSHTSSALSWKGGTVSPKTASIIVPRHIPPFDILSLKDSFGISDPKDKYLLRHFIRVVSRTLSVVQEDESNPFLSLIVSLAGSSKVVIESLLALSASHLRQIYPGILQKGLSHQNEGMPIS